MPKLTGRNRLFQTLLRLSCVLFLVAGFGMLSMSMYLKYANVQSHELLEKNIPELRSLFIFGPLVTMIFGFSLMGLGIFGYFVAVRRIRFLLIVFFAIVLVVFIVELIVGFSAFAFKGNLKQLLDTQLEAVWANSNPPIYNERMQIQFLFGCCGFRTMSDRPGPDCRPQFHQACYPAVEARVSGLADAAGIALIATASIELLALIFSLGLCIGLGQDAAPPTTEQSELLATKQ